MIRCNLTIIGNGQTLQRTGLADYRLLTVDQAASLSVNNLTITGGRASAIGGSAIFNFQGNLTVISSTITNRSMNRW